MADQPEDAGRVIARSGFARRRVLVIDEDLEYQGFLMVLLEGRGYTVFSALDSGTGMELFDLVQPDLVLLDAQARGADPLEMCEFLTTHGSRPAVIIVSDEPAADDDFFLAEQAGATAILERPFDIDVVLDQVAHAVQAHPRQPLA
jgi:DNA-binding response OmpR family regulator